MPLTFAVARAEKSNRIKKHLDHIFVVINNPLFFGMICMWPLFIKVPCLLANQKTNRKILKVTRT